MPSSPTRMSDVVEIRHMARLPSCAGQSIEARTWYRKAEGYWRVFGHRFNPGDQVKYCDFVEMIPSTPIQTLSSHVISRKALKDANWPALILIQLGFKAWGKFSNTAVGKAFSQALPGAELGFPIPNGGSYPKAELMTPEARQQILEEWQEILTLQSRSRILFSEPPQTISPVPLPLHIRPHVQSPTTMNPIDSTRLPRSSSSPCLTRSQRLPRATAVALLASQRGSPPRASRRLRYVRDESSLFVTSGPSSSPYNDTASVASSSANADDLPLPSPLRWQRSLQSTQRHRAEVKPKGKRTRRGALTPLSASASNTRTSDEDVSLSPSLSTRDRVDVDLTSAEEPQGEKRIRTDEDEQEGRFDNQEKDYGKRMRVKQRHFKKQLHTLKKDQSAMITELKEIKGRLKEQQRGIDGLERELDLMAIEFRLREDARLERVAAARNVPKV